ncbi:MBL fold metallo-hydrolase [Ktedonosporobacter rubrisoli]|uniref:MBL fold metallo-hydrolase n=1 Tax=Ktedonosporobacter rubrisoli TaxID=2509675 RepID=A0A4P6K0R1_KTERU|nr:MBL fold metallo-hydrolase [Ktedonosporobacter rubrisoli]QBD81634.1 MBL fold metallo-hydrolase [Ktedonosporobacter rubrisoli]
MSKWTYTRGLHDLGNSVYAYLQPNGSWGWSNAGLIVDGEASLLVDTLFDLTLTREMLSSMRKAVPATAHIDMVVNTHANGDHWFGNQLVADARIIASRRTVEQIPAELTPQQRAEMIQQAHGHLATFLRHAYGAFDFNNIHLTPPKETFEGECVLHVGAKEVRLIELGPAHTRGDTIVYVPADRTVFAADLLFIGGHPIAWSGPVSNWIKACDYLLSLDVETIVPGHGPITDKQGVREFKGYLEYVFAQTHKYYEAGIPALEASRSLELNRYADWIDSERIVVTVATIYRELSNSSVYPEKIRSFEHMAQFAFSQGK